MERDLLGEGLSPCFSVSHLCQGFAFLVAPASRVRWIAKGEDCQNLDLLGDAEQRLDLFQMVETNPVGANSLSPGGEDHILDGPTGIRNGDLIALVDADHYRQRSLLDIGTGGCQASQLVQSLLVLHDDEMPGLPVGSTGG